MINFRSFICEKKDEDSNTLHAFDIDDTLFHHDPEGMRIHVIDPQGNRSRTLTSSEFNTHTLPDNHSYDFREFRSSDAFGKHARPIRKMIAKLKAIHKNNKNVEILTARSDLDDQKKFAHHMSKYGIDIGEIHVRRAGNLPMKAADAKAAIMHDQIKKNKYSRVHLYDDSEDNLKKFIALKKHHPEVEFHAHHVKHDPETGEVVVTTTSIKPKPLKEN